MDKYKFGEFIYQRRKKLGLTQDELGRRLGVTNKAVSKWETGETFPDITIIDSLARVLDVGIDELITQKPYVSSAENSWRRKTTILAVTTGLLAALLLALVPVTVLTMTKKTPSVVLDAENCLDYLYIDPLTNLRFGDADSLELSASAGLSGRYESVGTISLEVDISVHTYFINQEGQEAVYSYLNRSLNFYFKTGGETKNLSLVPNTELQVRKFLKIDIEYSVASAVGTLKELRK